MDHEILLQMLGVSTVEEAATKLTALNATITDLRAATGVTSDTGVVRVVNLATAGMRQIEQLTGKSGPDALAVVNAWKAEAEQLPAAKADAEVAKTELANAKKKAKKAEDDEEDEEEEDEEMAAKNAIVEACRSITGVQDIVALEGAVMALGPKLKGAADASAARQIQVSGLIATGKLLPAQKKWAMKCKPEALAAYLESMGGAKVGPVDEEHQPDDEAPEVKAAREAQKPPEFDPSKVTLDETELKMCSIRDPHNADGFQAKYLADKVARAKAEFEAKARR